MQNVITGFALNAILTEHDLDKYFSLHKILRHEHFVRSLGMQLFLVFTFYVSKTEATLLLPLILQDFPKKRFAHNSYVFLSDPYVKEIFLFMST